MNIRSMLLRLEDSLNRSDLMEQMLLVPELELPDSIWTKSTKPVNLVVGYNGSPNSQTALDLTMWIAHQTRLVTQKTVTVQVVYVVEETQNNNYLVQQGVGDRMWSTGQGKEEDDNSNLPLKSQFTDSQAKNIGTIPQTPNSPPRQPILPPLSSEDGVSWTRFDEFSLFADLDCSSSCSLTSELSLEAASINAATAVLTPTNFRHLAVKVENRKSAHQYSSNPAMLYRGKVLEQANHILGQACYLAKEWGSSFKAHLRLGDVATELREVVELEAATLLFLGCSCVRHPLVQKLEPNFPCAVLGIPST